MFGGGGGGLKLNPPGGRFYLVIRNIQVSCTCMVIGIKTMQMTTHGCSGLSWCNKYFTLFVPLL